MKYKFLIIFNLHDGGASVKTLLLSLRITGENKLFGVRQNSKNKIFVCRSILIVQGNSDGTGTQIDTRDEFSRVIFH